MDEDRLQFGTKEQIFSILRQVEGLDAHAIASQNQPPGGLAPQRDGEHAAHAGKAGRIPRQEGMEHGLGVAMGMKLVAESFQFRPQFQMVIDFAVEDDDGVAILEVMG